MAVKRIKNINEGVQFNKKKFLQNCKDVRMRLGDLLDDNYYNNMDDLNNDDIGVIESEINDIIGICKSILSEFNLLDESKKVSNIRLKESSDYLAVYTKIAGIKQPPDKWGSVADYAEVYLQNTVRNPKTVVLAFEGVEGYRDIDVTDKSETEIIDIVRNTLNEIISDNNVNGKVSISKASIKRFYSQLDEYLKAAENPNIIDIDYVRKRLGKNAKIDVISDDKIRINDKYTLVMNGPKSFDVYGTRYDPNEPNGFTILSYAVGDILKNIKSKKESKKRRYINESKLREFTKSDWNAFAGAEEFDDGSQPLIAEFADGIITLIVSGTGDVDDDNEAIVQLIYNDYEESESGEGAWYKDFESKKDAIKFALEASTELDYYTAEDTEYDDVENFAYSNKMSSLM